MNQLKSIVTTIYEIPELLFLKAIKVYQFTLSADHAFWAQPEKFRICIYHPSCSEYTYQAIEKHGLIRGGIMGFFRILRCNPMSKPGHDPVPDKFSIRRNKGN